MSANIDSNLSTMTQLASHGSAVWVQLYYKGEVEGEDEGEDEPVGESYKITPIPEDVSDLKMKVHLLFSVELQHCSAGLLKVYPPGTTVLESTESLDPGDPVPANTSSKMPLIVIAPKPEQPNGKLRCCSRILALFNCWFVEATNELTAFLLLL
jgi:hypothetical protein